MLHQAYFIQKYYSATQNDVHRHNSFLTVFASVPLINSIIRVPFAYIDAKATSIYPLAVFLAQHGMR